VAGHTDNVLPSTWPGCASGVLPTLSCVRFGLVVSFETFSSGPRGDIAETVNSNPVFLPMEPRLAPYGRPL